VAASPFDAAGVRGIDTVVSLPMVSSVSSSGPAYISLIIDSSASRSSSDGVGEAGREPDIVSLFSMVFWYIQQESHF
jgi:hypothetical protein